MADGSCVGDPAMIEFTEVKMGSNSVIQLLFRLELDGLEFSFTIS